LSELRGRGLIESRFGKLGSGQASIVLKDAEYDLETLLTRMDLKLEDSWPIDVVTVAENTYCVRYYDGQDQRIVAHEFDGEFCFIRETRGHIAEWVGDADYYKWFRSAAFRCPLVPGDEF
jgi:hypothetical protein